MSAKPFDKSKLPSRYTTVGPARAPHRSFLYAMGLSSEEIAQPLVGVASCWNEAAPCNISLMRQAQVVKKGVASAQGTPREFCTITVTDGIAMGHQGMKASLVSRDVIADSVELTMRGHCYDAIVGLAGCDKSLPGMMMSMVRLNVPSIFIYGGSILPGSFRGRQITVQDVFEAVGNIRSVVCRTKICWKSNRSPVRRPVPAAPSLPPTRWRLWPKRLVWRCPIPAARRRLTKSVTGSPMLPVKRSWNCSPKQIRPRDIVTRKALENAAAVVAASGGSTNAALHLPAIAHECGIEFDLFDVAEIFKKTPYIADLKPGGKYVAKDMFEAGGIPLLMKTMLEHGYLHGDCMTVTGRTIAENMEKVLEPGSGRGAPRRQSDHRDRRRRRPQGQSRNRWRDREGCRDVERLKFTGPARCFDSEEECFNAVTNRGYKEGEVLVIRYEGPKGGPGMREMLSTTAAIYGQGMGDKVA
jgi:dihydroxy-acid dehydratase